MSTEIPKTFVVSITTHGNIILDDNYKPIVCPDFNGTNNIIKINASCPGVEHVTDIKTYKNSMSKIINYTNKNEHYCVDKFIEILTNYSDKLNEKLINKDLTGLDEIQNYLHHTNKSYQLETTKEGLYDKIFWKFDDPIYHSINFNSIHIINFMNLDVMELFDSHFTEKRKYVRLSELIDFLYGFGAEKIILLDLTCSTFVKLSEMKDIDDRTTRRIRRDIIKNKSN